MTEPTTGPATDPANPVDEVLTRITKAPSDEMAHAIIQATPVRLVMRLADQLYVETEGHGTRWIRNAIVKEARA